MEKNHLPSSPLQHHRPSSSHSSNPQSAETNETSKLSVPRPSNPNAGSPVATATISSWPPPEQQVDDRWHTEQSLWDGRGPSTQPLASSSRCPTPSTFPQLPKCSPHRPSTRLLTSEPLNRSASQHSPLIRTPCPTAPLTPTRKRHHRATSLPVSTPTFKRRKSRHYTTTPSDPWKRSIQPEKSEPTKHQLQRDRADALGQELLARRQLRNPSAARGEQMVVATKQPPVNVVSLRSLDAAEILKNPQLRHDLLFGSLAFRPINSSAPFPSSSAEIVSPGTEAPVDPRTSCIVADMYWESIAEEITTGCRCARWRMGGIEGKAEPAFLEKRERVTSCLCGKWRPDLTEAEWWRWQASPRWPSRLPELIKSEL